MADVPALFPDLEMWAASYLRPLLIGRGYAADTVGNRYRGKDVEVWVRRDGGPTLDGHREQPRLTVNVFKKGASDQGAADLAALVSAWLRGAHDETVRRVEQISGPSPVPDTLPRRLMSFDITVRGADLQPA